MSGFRIRRLRPNDSLEDLTDMLRRAFAPLGRLGLNCTCVDQTLEMTRQRSRLGDCFVAIVEDRIVGTVTLHATDRASPVRWYREPTVASIHQLAVDPGYQGFGIGRALLRLAETWARRRGYLELALDTPEGADHLLAFYGHHGFRRVGTMQLEGKSYRSGILSKATGRPEEEIEARPPVPAAPRRYGHVDVRGGRARPARPTASKIRP